MRVQIAHPTATPQQIEQHLRAVFPRYKVISRGGMPLVGDGAATGVLVKPSGPGVVTLVWGFPSMGAQLAVTLSIVLTGLLPGLIVFGIVWLVVQGGVARLKQEVASVLAGGAPPAQLPVAEGGHSSVVPPGVFAPVAAAICFALAVLSLAQSISYGGLGSGLLDILFWIALGVGAVMYQGEQKRAFDTRTAHSGPALWIPAM